MHKNQPGEVKTLLAGDRWSLRDFIVTAALFLASAAVTLWQNAHLTILWDASYTLDTSVRIALGQMPYRDFPLVHAPLTFLIQAAIIGLTGRVFFHHVVYAAIAGGLGTVLTWRITLNALRGRLRGYWTVAVLLAAPLTVLGIYSVLPFPSYDCDSVLSILFVILLLQRLPAASDPVGSVQSIGAWAFFRYFFAGAAIPLPMFFKQNIGLPMLAAAFTLVLLLLIARWVRRGSASFGSADLGALLCGAVASLLVAVILLHFTCGVGNYIHWTIRFAAQRRLPGLTDMLGIYAEPSLLWWIPVVAAALVLLQSHVAKALWARLVALGLLAAPFIWTLVGLFLSSDMDDRAADLLALWPLLLVLSGALTLLNLWRDLLRNPGHDAGPRALLPFLTLVAINGTLLSQQLWGSTYAIWPLLVLLVAELVAFLASIESAQTNPEIAPRLRFVTPVLAVVVSATLAVCGGLYMASEERLSYANLEGRVAHSAEPALRGMALAGEYLPEFEELLRFAASEIPSSDGMILMPGEDPFYFVTDRIPQFPVLLFDRSTDPLSPAELVNESRARKIRWLIVKRDLQIKEDPTPQRATALDALQQVFLPYRTLKGYSVYRRP